jgi:hypothetical protein
MPLLNWNPDRRPSAIKVAQQLDTILQGVIQTLSNETGMLLSSRFNTYLLKISNN